jgi:hypothetical protein
MRVQAVASLESIGCPRCLWGRTTFGGDARRRLVVTLRAHVAVWHPDADVDALLAPEIVAPQRAVPRAAIRPPARRPPSRPTLPVAIG